jgi:putative cell wall-binding protein
VLRPRLLSLVVLASIALAGCSLGDDAGRPPQLGASSDDKEAAAKLGFPASATKNTIRVGGGDAAADAAGVASAVFPAVGPSSRPTAVVLADSEDWQGAVTASVLAASPIGAPILLSNGGDLPAASSETLDRLKPKGSDLSKDAQVIRIGEDTPKPGGFKTAVIQGKDPYERAAAIDRFASTARGRPSNDLMVVSGERADWAMPAAAWAARKGDSVLLTRRDSIPAPTRKAIQAHEKPNIFLVGSKTVVSAKVEKELSELGKVKRIEGPTPVQNAIAFARFDQGDFGWNVNVPGYNFTIASTTRPADAAAAASLATRGVFAPLLVTNRADQLPKPLEAYFLSVQPGYEDDPGEAVYNRVWILGDDKVFSLPAQNRLDQITELIPVQVNAP